MCGFFQVRLRPFCCVVLRFYSIHSGDSRFILLGFGSVKLVQV